MTLPIVENVRGFFVSRPPLVVFMICLGSFAVALITFAYIVKVKDMPNPDVTEDWNTFLDKLTQLNYCVVSEPGATITNASQMVAGASGGQSLKDRLSQLLQNGVTTKQDIGTAAAPSAYSPTSVINVTAMMDLELMPTPTLQRIASKHNFTFITTTLTGAQLGLYGDRRHLETNLTIVLPPLGNQSHYCQHGACYKLSACVTMTSLPQFFPKTQRPDAEETCVKDIDLGGENHFHLEVTPSYIHCVNASILSLEHEMDPTLTVMLTMDRSVINLHLMHTSYFLFVMMITLFCYALVKGRPNKVKVVYTQCTSDKNGSNHA
ncbi:transmembrane protein 248-like isoform X2 [Littorina saxatilis]|uniref:TMEM248/TMEM219 domain-containing protein n=1 Tax=Littorina saxatilis TaxID=31220 RepID=A0AAN9AJN7_9CAEN